SQVRLSYSDGPLSWAVAIEEPTFYSDTNMPNIAGYLKYDIAGGHQFIVTGEVADWDPSEAGCTGATAGIDGLDGTADDVAATCAIDGNDELGWAIQAGANFNLWDVATLTGGFGYGEGLLETKFAGVGMDPVNDVGDPLETLAFLVGLSFGLSETTTFNAMFSYVEALEDQFSDDDIEKAYKVHANILWQPVKQMRMGWEVIWAETKDYNGVKEDGVRATFGTWFFF
ncbi:MAG: hypothetical protein WBN88_10870, partial [Anderseniella sp.]